MPAKYMIPTRKDSEGGPHLPPWLFRTGLNADELIVWAVMARCADKGGAVRGFTAERIASIAGIPTHRVRRALTTLTAKDLLESRLDKGKASTYKFLAHPESQREWGSPNAHRHQSRRLTWSRLVDLADHPEGFEYWRPW